MIVSLFAESIRQDKAMCVECFFSLQLSVVDPGCVVDIVAVSQFSFCSVADLDGCEAQHDKAGFSLLAWLAL
jgi:hypothetical protein